MKTKRVFFCFEQRNRKAQIIVYVTIISTTANRLPFNYWMFEEAIVYQQKNKRVKSNLKKYLTGQKDITYTRMDNQADNPARLIKHLDFLDAKFRNAVIF